MEKNLWKQRSALVVMVVEKLKSYAHYVEEPANMVDVELVIVALFAMELVETDLTKKAIHVIFVGEVETSHKLQKPRATWVLFFIRTPNLALCFFKTQQSDAKIGVRIYLFPLQVEVAHKPRPAFRATTWSVRKAVWYL